MNSDALEFERALRGTVWSRFAKVVRKLFGLHGHRRRAGSAVLTDDFERRAALKRVAAALTSDKTPARKET